MNGSSTCGRNSAGSGGGGGSSSIVTGAGGAGGAGGTGWANRTVLGGSGGVAGAATFVSGAIANRLDRAGGAGGNGGDAPDVVPNLPVGGSGGGGGGGFGWVLNAPGSSGNSARIVGGAGGAAGSTIYGGSGGGGQGGGGLLSTAGGAILNSGQLLGGAGGAGGPSVYYPGKGGDGGDGVVMTQGGVLVNGSEVRGGNGGAAGATNYSPGVRSTAPGLGGVGVNYTGNAGRILNGSVIAGGLSGSGVQADAIRIAGNNNTLELQAGFSNIGNVVASGNGNVLALGGPFDGSFAASSIGAAAQYRGFAQFNKLGSSTWTLTGSTAAITPWTLESGTLVVSSDANLGATAGGLTLQGGVLQTTASFSSARSLNLNGAGSEINTATGTTLTLFGAVSGSVAWSKTGAGTVVLAGVNNANSAAILSAGTLQVGDGGTAGSLGTGRVINDAALVFNRSDRLVAGNIISGTGTVTQAGTGVTVLTGANTYTGGTTISDGTLEISNDANLGAATGRLALQGGVLRTTASFNSARAVTLAGSGGGIDTVAGSMLTLSGTLSGSAAWRKTGTGTLVLTGPNTYAGATTVTAGTLRAGAANAFSAGSVHSVASGATLELNDFDQTINSLTGAGTVAFGSAKLSVGADNSSSTFSGDLSGTGSLTKTGSGTLTLGGSSSYSGGTALKGGRIEVGSASALGTGALAMDDGTMLGFASDGLTLANAIELTGRNDPVIDTGSFSATLAGGIGGGGFLTKQGSGTLTLAAANNIYTGATDVAAGTLQAGAANAFSAASQHTVAAGATLDTGGFDQSIAGLANSGTVSLLGAAPGSTLTLTGPYVGNGGVLRLGTALGSSASVSDRLLLSGASAVASGSTTLQITNLGGLGGYTTGNGIEVIGTTGGASVLGGAFTLAGGHVDAGAFEYRLNLTAGGGYLSNLAPPPPVEPAVPTVPVAPADPTVPLAPAPAAIPPAAGLPLYRAEVPLFAALPEQLQQGNLAMLGNLHQRRGDDDLKTANTANTAGTGTGERRAWGRVLSTNLHIRQQGTVSPTSHGRSTGFQAGTDLFASADANANWRAGIYVGRLDGDMQVDGFARGIANLGVGSNSLRSEYLGAYGTYTTDSGFYADAVLQGGRHRYDASPGGTYFASHGKASSLLASIEVGQAFTLAGSWKIEPQLQYVHQRLRLDDVALSGASVRQDSNGRSLLRAGVRVKGEIATGIGALQPYARVNVYRHGSASDIANFVGPAATTAIATRTGGTSTELAAGATLALNDRVSLYGELGKLWASGGSAKVSSSVQGSLGARFKW